MGKKTFEQGDWSKTEIAKLLQKAAFIDSAASPKQYPDDTGVEVAFVGRSNVGKSTCINTLTNQKRLAHASKTPGRTQLINFFKLTDQQRLVDLPGYGYAKVATAVKESWAQNIELYLSSRMSLAGIVWLVDSRRSLVDQDLILLNWLVRHQIPTQILVSKVDKLSKNQAFQSMQAIKKQIKNDVVDVHHLEGGLWSLIDIQLFSSTAKTGVLELGERLEQWFSKFEESDCIKENNSIEES